MLDLFTIFTKGGIVLWCFRGTQEIFSSPVNALIRSVILQVRIYFLYVLKWKKPFKIGLFISFS